MLSVQDAVASYIELPVTVGASGASGGSATSVTAMVTVAVASTTGVVSVLPSASLPSVTLTVTG